MSKRVEEYIKNYTRNYSNIILIPLKLKDNKGCYTESYSPWLTPDHARAVAEIAKEEVIEKAVKWLNKNTGFFNEKDFRKYMEEKI